MRLIQQMICWLVLSTLLTGCGVSAPSLPTSDTQVSTLSLPTATAQVSDALSPTAAMQPCDSERIIRAAQEGAKVLLTQEWKDGIFTLEAYEAAGCSCVFLTYERPGFEVQREGGCREPFPSGYFDQWTSSEGINPALGEYHLAYGVVRGDEPASVRLTWRDGEVMVVPIVMGGFLEVDEGAGDLTRLEVLGRDGTVLDQLGTGAP